MRRWGVAEQSQNLQERVARLKLMERRASKQLRRYLVGQARPCAVDGQLHHNSRRVFAGTSITMQPRKRYWQLTMRSAIEQQGLVYSCPERVGVSSRRGMGCNQSSSLAVQAAFSQACHTQKLQRRPWQTQIF